MLKILCNKGISFLALMIIIAVTALLLRFLIEEVMMVNIQQNEQMASANLKLLSAALENYAKNNMGVFPASISFLTQTKPRYLDRDYIGESPIKGYVYGCERLEPGGYKCSTVPLKCRITGLTNYTITTGGSFLPEDCAKPKKAAGQ